MSNAGIDFDSALGVDFSCIDDIDASLSLVDGRTCLGQAVARRITTPRGGLFYDSDYGIDIRDFIKQTGFSETQAARIIESEILKDERVNNVVANVTFNQLAEEVSIIITVTDEQGPFVLTVTVDNLTVELLQSDIAIP